MPVIFIDSPGRNAVDRDKAMLLIGISKSQHRDEVSEGAESVELSKGIEGEISTT